MIMDPKDDLKNIQRTIEQRKFHENPLKTSGLIAGETASPQIFHLTPFKFNYN